MSVTTIGEDAFYSCPSLKSIFIPAPVSAIGYGAFQKAGLESVHIASGTTPLVIDTSAFSRCSGLAGATIELPQRVTRVGTNAFDCIPNTTFKIYNDQLELWEEDSHVLGGVPRVKVPADKASDADKEKWDYYDSGDGYLYMSFSDPWYDGGETAYDTSNNFNWTPYVDVRSSTVYYPNTLSYDSSLSFKGYVEQAIADRAEYEDPNADHYTP